MLPLPVGFHSMASSSPQLPPALLGCSGPCSEGGTWWCSQWIRRVTHRRRSSRRWLSCGAHRWLGLHTLRRVIVAMSAYQRLVPERASGSSWRHIWSALLDLCQPRGCMHEGGQGRQSPSMSTGGRGQRRWWLCNSDLENLLQIWLGRVLWCAWMSEQQLWDEVVGRVDGGAFASGAWEVVATAVMTATGVVCLLGGIVVGALAHLPPSGFSIL